MTSRRQGSRRNRVRQKTHRRSPLPLIPGRPRPAGKMCHRRRLSPHHPEDDPLSPKPGPGADRHRSNRHHWVPAALTPVPSCVLIGNKLDNFALNDLDGRPWEYKRPPREIYTAPILAHNLFALPRHSPLPGEMAEKLWVWGTRSGKHRLRTVRARTPDQQRPHEAHPVFNQLHDAAGTGTLSGRQQFKVDLHPTLVLLNEKGQIILARRGL